MILVVLSLLALLTVPIAGGRLSQLAHVSLRGVWAVWTSIAIQLLITVGGRHVPMPVAELLHLASYGLSAWCVWTNRHLPGVTVLAVGGATNLLAIVANGGSMPATEWAWRTSGLRAATAGHFENSAASSGSALWFLGDVFAVPHGWPLANVFSIGDVVIVIGLIVFAHVSCRPAMARSPHASTAP
ncbi:MAG: diguanylate cyclase/phosphodiesterase & domain with sensor(s) [Ilumatobacteraceae bacterium]|nr:diguanylate cyclase/phosphodiesterase & domain with sensor(s) [Ilumatobacteraceae bacterium]